MFLLGMYCESVSWKKFKNGKEGRGKKKRKETYFPVKFATVLIA